jgi:hypothetical protein
MAASQERSTGQPEIAKRERGADIQAKPLPEIERYPKTQLNKPIVVQQPALQLEVK